jgi:UDP-glucose 4-epimerase
VTARSQILKDSLGRLIVSTILVTGSGGYLGSRLVQVLAADHDLISLSRSPAGNPRRLVQGDFTDAAALTALDGERIDVVVHLAAVTGDCSEEDAMNVNVSGTRRLVRWAVEHGVRRFVLASSIAAVGCLSPTFLPRELPIPDDYPCEAVDAYGLSKAMVEELGAYFHRQLPELDMALARIGVVQRKDEPPVTGEIVKAMPAPFAKLGSVGVADAITALAAMAERPAGPGFHRVNLVASRIRCSMPTADTVRLLLGPKADGLDFSHYAQSGHESDSLYATSRMTELFGFRPIIDPATLREASSL